MSYRFGLVALLGISTIIPSGGCGDSPAVCEGACIIAGATIDQTTLPSPIVSLTADPGCTVTHEPIDGGTEVVVGLDQNTAGLSGSCQIHETLADGSTWVAVLSWDPVGGTGCCANSTHNVGPAPTFTRGNDGSP